MHTIFASTAAHHDSTLIVASLALAILGTFVAMALLRLARTARASRQGPILALATLAGANAAWTTHFLAMLGHDAGRLASYAPGTTVLSLVVMTVAAWVAFALTIRARTMKQAAGAGVILGLGLAAMHFLGVAAANFGAELTWSPGLVALSVAFSVTGATLAILVFWRLRGPTSAVLSTPLFAMAIGLLHFTAMAALEIGPAQPMGGVPPWLGWGIATAGVAVIASALVCLVMERRQRRREQAEAERLRDISNIALEGLILTDGKAIVTANTSFLDMHGSISAQLDGQPVDSVLDPRDVPDLITEGTVDPRESRLTSREGEDIPVELAARPIEFRDSQHWVIAVRDLRSRKQAESKIRQLAYTDSLTGLANRESFAWQIDKALERIRRVGGKAALLAIDLDNFKAINDTMGHGIGDRALQVMSERILCAVRSADTAARLGGDEFSILQTDVAQPAAAERAAERLVEILSRPLILEGHVIAPGASVGIAVAPDDAEGAEDLQKFADLALYSAKDEGRGRFVFYEEEMNLAMRERRSLENDLRLAMGREELAVHFQPLFQSRNSGLVGFEALLRWTHPERGRISPEDFIPLAEQSGLIIQIGKFVMERACAEAATWPDPLFVSVNLSPAQFENGKITHTIASALERSGLSAERLEVEITESLLLKNTAQVQEQLREIRALGVRIAMDDFGTGYSSLSTLRSFPFDRVKIDRSFVGDMQNTESAAIVRAIIGLGRSLGMSTTAEGVETDEQIRTIQEEGCELLQGFRLGEPGDATAARALIEKGARRAS